MHILQYVLPYMCMKQYLLFIYAHILRHNLYIHKLRYFQFIYAHIMIFTNRYMDILHIYNDGTSFIKMYLRRWYYQ